MTDGVELPRLTACRSCGGEELVDVLDLGRSPLANALVDPGTPEPDATYPLELVTCPACGLLQLAHSVPPTELFHDYAYFSSYVQTLVDNAQALVTRLVADRGLGGGDLAVEVASNDGYLLQHYLAAGVPVLGIDPADNVAAVAAEKGVETVVEFFGVDVAKRLRDERGGASVIHANNVLAHVPEVNDVVAGFRELLRPDGVVVVETPYQREMIDELEFDTTYHEHLYYYSLTSLQALFERNGLTIVDVEQIPIHGTSLRVTAAHSTTAEPGPAVVDLRAEEDRIGLAAPGYVADFGDRVQHLCGSLGVLLRDLKAGGATIAAYGAAAKGTTLLNAIEVGTDVIDVVADKSPIKQGRMIPGVRLPIVAPEEMLALEPDYVLLLAWNVAEEIMRSQPAVWARGARWIVPVPAPTIR